MFLQMLFVRQTRVFRHEVAQVVIQNEHAEVFRHLVCGFDYRRGPFADDGAHDDKRQRQTELPPEIEQETESVPGLPERSRSANLVVRILVAIDGKDHCQILYPGQGLEVILHESAIRGNQHIELALAKGLEQNIYMLVSERLTA